MGCHDTSKMWEVYQTGWGLADWTGSDNLWEAVDVALEDNYIGGPLQSWLYDNLTDMQRTYLTNIYATPLGRFDRWAVTPDDIRLANCATIIKRAFRTASNDPSYKMCQALIMPPAEEFDALCSAI